MGDQQSLNQLLQWGIKNSDASRNESSSKTRHDAAQGLSSKALAELLGGPSDADRMRSAMAAIVAPTAEVPIEQKLTAWDNLEQLIEQIDNANNLEPLKLWGPLVHQLDSEHADMRRMAAWCISTAVQNNVKSQERLLATGAIARLAQLALQDSDRAARKKAVSALSSEVRNFQPALDELEAALPQDVWSEPRGRLDASDMDAVDRLIQKLRDRIAEA